jgi:hypothetical protein
METFFFISLGITFVLILLLVYHFKQRLSAIEQKNDTMFDIINNLVQEISTIKTFVVANIAHRAEFNVASSPLMPYIPQSVYESQKPNGIFSQNTEADNIVYGKEDEDEDEDEDSDTSGSEVDTDSDDEEDSDDEKIIVSDNEETSTVKVINVSIPTTEIEDIPDFSEVNEAMDENDLVESLPDMNVAEEESIVVHKLEPSNIPLDETNVKEEEEVSVAVYSKLSLSELKKLAISKGVATDVSKLKKPQLIQLLESVSNAM